MLQNDTYHMKSFIKRLKTYKNSTTSRSWVCTICQPQNSTWNIKKCYGRLYFPTWTQEFLFTWSSYNMAFTFLPSRSGGVGVSMFPFLSSAWAYNYGGNNVVWLLKVVHKRWHDFYLLFLEHFLLESSDHAGKKPKLHEEATCTYVFQLMALNEVLAKSHHEPPDRWVRKALRWLQPQQPSDCNFMKEPPVNPQHSKR